MTSGLAINLWGQGIHLPEDVEVELVASELPGSEGAAVFDRCDDAPVSSLHHGTTSAYILTIASASEFEGNVPIHQLSDKRKADTESIYYLLNYSLLRRRRKLAVVIRSGCKFSG